MERERTFKNLCDAEIEVNKAGFTRWNTLEVVEQTERRFEIKITRCLYHELTTALGIPELTPVVCQIDNAAFNSYLPDKVVFNRGGPNRRIADGNKRMQVCLGGHRRAGARSILSYLIAVGPISAPRR
jgi:hypothetical protein